MSRNDPKAIRALYSAHFPAVRRYVLQNNGRMDDAQDMFQEAFMALWLRVKQGSFNTDGSQDPGGFLFQVAKNKWLDVLRSAGRRQMSMVHNSRLEQVVAPAQDDDIDQRLGRLREVYGLLDEKCRQVLDQFYFERKDLAAIAEAMGVGEESIRTIKYRCMMKLRASRRKIGGEDWNEA